ncbi:MAG: hypothetical protein ABI432_16885 [Flavobacteriales bacterium]
MKKLMMIAALALLTAAGVQAQTKQQRTPAAAQAQDKPKQTPEERAKKLTARMTKDLGLSTEQATKVEALNLRYVEQAQALHTEREAQMAAQKDGKGKEMRDAHDAELKAILTPDQYSKWMTEREAAKEKHKEQRKQERGDQKQ